VAGRGPNGSSEKVLICFDAGETEKGAAFIDVKNSRS
jgi:hypothetical protein